MFDLKVGDWVIPKAVFEIIDAEKSSGKAAPITTHEPLKIRAIASHEQENEKLEFYGKNGKFLAAFFEKTSPPTQ